MSLTDGFLFLQGPAGDTGVAGAVGHAGPRVSEILNQFFSPVLYTKLHHTEQLAEVLAC